MDFAEMWNRAPVLCLVVLLVALVQPVATAGDMPSSGQEPPRVSGINVLTGETVSIEKTDDPTLMLLFFFTLGNDASEQGLHLLEMLRQQHTDAKLGVIAVSPKDSPDRLRSFAESKKLQYAIVADENKAISDAYGVGNAFPMTFVIAPYVPRVTNVLVGGGRGTQRMLIAVAEKFLSQGRPKDAQSVATMAAESDPADAGAKAVLGYSFLAQGKVADAERTFEEMKALPNGEVAALEGMARVRVSQDRLDEALELADAAQQKAHETLPGAAVAKAEVYKRQGNLERAARELKTAAKSEGPDWQRAEALNELGRVQAERGSPAEAIETYSEAISIDPYNLEALSNKGAAHVEMGEPEKAVESLQTAKLLNPQDEIVAGLLRDAVRAQQEANDLERQKLIREQVETLKKRFQEQQAVLREAPVDEWTSRPLTVAILDFPVEGGMLDRAGTDRVILNQFGATLGESPRVTLVEREIIDTLLTELNLSSTELADPETRLRLGRLLAARVIAVGSFVPFGTNLMFSARLIDTETSQIVASVSPNLSAHGGIGPLAVSAADKCRSALADAYPLRGRIVDVDGDSIALDLGARHGVVAGMKFRVVREGKAITDSRGRVLSRRHEPVATLEVQNVEDAVSFATVLAQEEPLELNDKVTELR